MFFDDGLLLVFVGFVCFLCGFVFVFVVVYDFVDWWFGIGSNFDKVEICVCGDVKCVFDMYNVYLFFFWVD